MLPNPFIRKLVQISEEALPPVYVPLIFDGDFFILTQQDIRKIEDNRFFHISRVMPNGDLQPLSQQENLSSHQVVNSLLQYFQSKINFYQQQQQYSSLNGSCPEPMDVSMPGNTVASISQQLQWNKCENVSLTPFPIHYSQGTSMTEIDFKQHMKDMTSGAFRDCQICSQCKTPICYSNKSINTQEIKDVCKKKSNKPLDAREQLKRNKLRYSFP